MAALEKNFMCLGFKISGKYDILDVGKERIGKKRKEEEGEGEGVSETRGIKIVGRKLSGGLECAAYIVKIVVVTGLHAVEFER